MFRTLPSIHRAINRSMFLSPSMLATSIITAGLVQPVYAQPRPAAQVLAPVVLTTADLGVGHLNNPDDLLESLGAHELVALAIPKADIPEQLTIVIPINGHPATLQLARHSVRTPDFKCYVEMGDGVSYEFDPGPDRTYVGSVIGNPGSVVTATLMPGGRLTARIQLNNQQLWNVEELTALGDGMHVVFNNSEAPELEQGWCGVLNNPNQVPQDGGFTERDVTLFRAIMDVEGDFEWFGDWGSDWFTEISGIVNDGNSIYLNADDGLAICHVIKESRIWAANVDPYTDSNASNILGQVRVRYYNDQPMAGQYRTAVHLFSGKDFDGATVGLANVGGINHCGTGATPGQNVPGDGPNGTDVIQDGWTRRYWAAGITEGISIRSRRVHVFAHEVGHNWNADHCDGDPTCDIMRAVVPSGAGSTRFGTTSSGVIIARRNAIDDCARECTFSGALALCTGYCAYDNFPAAAALAPLNSTVSLYSGGRPGIANLPWDASNLRYTRPMRLVAPNEPVRLR